MTPPSGATAPKRFQNFKKKSLKVKFVPIVIRILKNSTHIINAVFEGLQDGGLQFPPTNDFDPDSHFPQKSKISKRSQEGVVGRKRFFTTDLDKTRRDLHFDPLHDFFWFWGSGIHKGLGGRLVPFFRVGWGETGGGSENFIFWGNFCLSQIAPGYSFGASGYVLKVTGVTFVPRTATGVVESWKN